MQNVNRFAAKHFRYCTLGFFISKTRKRLNLSIRSLCLESNIGTDTYYRLIAGHDHHLNVYIRLFECFAAYCEPEIYQELVSDFALLSRVELCAKRGMNMEKDVWKVWRKYRP